jgi:hypothetical protein
MIDVATIPDALKEGENWHLLDIDPEWMWVSRDRAGQIVGFLLAANCHGLVFIWRLKMLPTAPRWALGRLFRQFIRDIRKRHALGYIAMLDVVNRPNEKALARIAFRAGGMFATATSVIVGSVNAKHVGGE